MKTDGILRCWLKNFTFRQRYVCLDEATNLSNKVIEQTEESIVYVTISLSPIGVCHIIWIDTIHVKWKVKEYIIWNKGELNRE